MIQNNGIVFVRAGLQPVRLIKAALMIRRERLIAALSCVLLFVAPGFAQTRGVISGAVVDQTGGVLVGATVGRTGADGDSRTVPISAERSIFLALMRTRPPNRTRSCNNKATA